MWTTRVCLVAVAVWVLYNSFHGGGSVWWRVIGVLVAAADIGALIYEERRQRRARGQSQPNR